MPWTAYNLHKIEETYLYRFLSLEYLLNFLETGGFWFSRADKFGDKMECVRIKDLDGHPDYNEIERRKQKFLICCWHLATNESLALWDNYVSNPEKRRVAAIRFKRQYLVSLMNNWFYRNQRFHDKTKWIHGMIRYKNMVTVDQTNLNLSAVKYPALRKEKAFEYEREYRFVVELHKPASLNGFLYLSKPTKSLDFDILINPLLIKEEFARVKTSIDVAGFSEKVKDSSLAKWLKPEIW